MSQTPGDLRRRVGDVVRVARGPADQPPGDAADELLDRHLEQETVPCGGPARRASRRAPRPGPGCAGSRRAGTPPAASGRRQPLAQHADRDLVGHELAAVVVALGLAARAPCRSAMWARNMSPVAMCGSPVAVGDRVRPACPCRHPGAPNRQDCRGSSPDEEALVVAHHELRLHLPHRVERHAHDDQDRGAAERRARPPARTRTYLIRMFGSTAMMPGRARRGTSAG